MPITLRQAKQFYNARRAWLGEGGNPSPNAQQRADTCLSCPHNVHKPWQELVTGAVAQIVGTQLELKGKMMLAIKGEEKLHTCNLCNCYLPLKVHVPLEIARVNTPDWEKFPEWCWLIREKKP